MRPRHRLLASVAALCACPGMAAAAPSLSDPVLSPSAWNNRVAVLLPRAGMHVVTVRVRDALGNRVESATLAIRVPTPQEEADRRVEPRPRGPVAGAPGDAPGAAGPLDRRPGARLPVTAGLALRGPVLVARSAPRWRSLLGASEAGRYTGYTTLRGDLLLGPAATRGLDALARTRRPGSRAAPSHADLDAMVMGLAVLLHATGPVASADIRATRSGRAFEEGFVEATTVDLLPSLVGALDVPPPLGAGLRAAARRYRPAYRAERSWARRMSARATRRPAGSPAARAFRAGVTDRWGSDRWRRLARATGLGEPVLRAEAIER